MTALSQTRSFSSINTWRASRSRTLAGRLCGVLAGTLACTLLTGCFTEGGAFPGYSSDSYTYASTSWQPKTVTLRDTRTGQDVWSADVPVGKKLVMQFGAGGTKDAFTPDEMEWAIVDDSDDFPKLGNSQPVPNKTVRRIDVTLRAVPEMPEGMTPARPGTPRAGSGSEQQ